MKSDKKGFVLLMEWSGKDRRYLYAAIVLALLSSLSTIVPYFAFYQIIDAVVLETCDFSFALKWAAIVLIATVVRVCCNLTASLSSHRGDLQHLIPGALHDDGAYGEDAAGRPE